MGYGYEFPHAHNFDSDLRQIIEMIKALGNLPKEFYDFKNSVEKIIYGNDFVITYNAETETMIIERRRDTNG